MSRILTDIGYSARSFMRAPGTALALLFTIALGVGSNITIQGFNRGLMGRDSPIERVVSLFRRDAHREAGPFSYEDYLSLKSHKDAFEWIGAARISQGIIGVAAQSQTVAMAEVTPHLAGLFDLPLGKGIVISHRLWQSEFLAGNAVTGERVRIDGVTFRIAGIAPDWLAGVYRDHPVDVWMPLREDTLRGINRRNRNVWLLGRLRDASGMDPNVLTDASAGPLAGTRVLPYTGVMPETGEGLSRIGTLLGFAASTVFCIACINVASLLLGRASARSRETSLCIALGAGRVQLAGQLVADSVFIAVSGGALGALLAVWTLRLVPAFLFEQDAERLVFAPDLFGITAASALCVGIIVVCGLLPLLSISHHNPAAVLRRESAGPSMTIVRLRRGLVVAQMTSCCMLVISSAVLLESFYAARQTNVRQRLGQPILATVQANPDIGIRYFQAVEQAARSLPGITETAWAGELPGSQPTWRDFRIEPRQLPLREVTMDVAAFTADSIPLFILPPIAGRLFGYGDQTCRVAIVNQEAATVLFESETVGRLILDAAGMPVEIIGVVAEKRNVAQPRRPAIYYYADQKERAPERMPLAHFRVPAVSKLDRAELDANIVSPGYFPAMGSALVTGRLFQDEPMSQGCRVGVINQEAADLYFGGNAVGVAVIDNTGRRTEIIGVVRTVPLGTFQRRMEPAIYFPMAQDYLPRMTLILGTRQATDPMLATVRRALASVPGSGPAPLVVKTLDTHLDQSALAPMRIAALMISSSAATALLLTVLGLYGALSDAARQRRRELAIRIALGAHRRHVIGQVLREGGRLACAGTLAGVLGSILLSRLLAGITSSNEWPALWVWLSAPLMLACVVALASLLPASRALMVSPLRILRDDE